MAGPIVKSLNVIFWQGFPIRAKPEKLVVMSRSLQSEAQTDLHQSARLALFVEEGKTNEPS